MDIGREADWHAYHNAGIATLPSGRALRTNKGIVVLHATNFLGAYSSPTVTVVMTSSTGRSYPTGPFPNSAACDFTIAYVIAKSMVIDIYAYRLSKAQLGVVNPFGNDTGVRLHPNYLGMRMKIPIELGTPSHQASHRHKAPDNPSLLRELGLRIR